MKISELTKIFLIPARGKLTELQAVVLGLVQGLGEFLPISGLAHLILVPWLFIWEDPGLTFDIALHLGTLIAVTIYFWKDWLRLLSKGFTDTKSADGRLFWYLVLATIPGVSRSGITMTTGLLLGMTREGATRFSFLLSAPIIFGAAAVKLPHIISHPSLITGNFVIGMAVSCITGIASIGFLLRYVQTKTFLPFVWYRFALGAVVFIIVLLR
jgi:undecaprenyl-diphosphatase